MSDVSPQLREQVIAARNDGKQLLIQGGGTKSKLGRAVNADAQLLSTAEHSGIVNYQPVELVMTARAGTPLAEIDQALAENGQMLASDPMRFGGSATIGGSLATNQAGPARPWVGSLRDHVLGIKLINGRAEHLKFGGQVMKNVAGYDLSRLQAGAMGTLGLITEVSFKVLPKPAASATIAQELPLTDAITRMNQIAGESKPISGACWVEGRMYVRFEGAERAVAASIRYSSGEQLASEEARQFWHDLRELQLGFYIDKEQQTLWRFSVNPAAEAAMLDQTWLINWVGAQRWLKGDFDAQKLHSLAQTMGGEVVRYRGGNRSDDIHNQNNPVLQQLHKNLKQALDPENIFNPGRLYSWMS